MFTLTSENVLLLAIGVMATVVSVVVCIDAVKDITECGLTECNLGALVCFSIMTVMGFISTLVGSGILTIV